MDVVNKIKADAVSSRRFQVASLLGMALAFFWIYGAFWLLYYDAADGDSPSFRFSEQQQSRIPYPELSLEATGDNTFTGVACTLADPMGMAPNIEGCIGNHPPQACYTISSFSDASPRFPTMTCKFKIAKPGQVVHTILVRAGFDTRGHEDFVHALHITPNSKVEVELTPRKVIVGDSTMWRFDTSAAYHGMDWVPEDVEIRFTLASFVPFVLTAYNPFPGWLVIASWGGLFTFLYAIIFGCIFRVAKLFLPDDSALFPGNGGGGAVGGGGGGSSAAYSSI